MARDIAFLQKVETGKSISNASEAVKIGTSKAKVVMREPTQAIAAIADNSDATVGQIDLQVVPGDDGTDTFKAGVAAASPGTGTRPKDPVFSEQRFAAGLSPTASDVNQGRDNHAMDQKDKDQASARRCVGEPPKGKDLGNRYIVASCESLSIISQRTGVGINDLINHNPQVKNPDQIYPNQELRMPPRG